MTREEKIALLIDELEDIRCDNFDADTDEDKTLKEVVRVIKALEQEPKWIPVSERSPKNSDRYLAYIVNEHDDKLKYIMTCEYVVDSYWHWFPDDECASDNVIAWMPLPEPYKAESEGEE